MNTVEPVEPYAGLYLCTRTSDYQDVKPCDEAFRVPLVAIDTRDVDDPKKIPINEGTDGDWYIKGSNHRVEDGRITRDMGIEEVWAVKLVDLQAFTDFVDKYGSCIIARDDRGFCTIEIYDAFCE